MQASNKVSVAYFDCNATTPTLAESANAAMVAMEDVFGNPSSLHLSGLKARAILDRARESAAKTIGCEPDDVIFTSGATEAIQTAVFSALWDARERLTPVGPAGLSRTKVLYSAAEHKAVPNAISHWAEALGMPTEVVELPVDEKGRVKKDALREHLPTAILVCTMAVNNETGVIEDLDGIAKVLGEWRAPDGALHDVARRPLWLVDSVQALGKLPLDMRKNRIDYASFSGHKIYSPKGIGFLFARKGAPLHPIMVGGGQERGLRSGTENVPGVAALGAMLDLIRTKPAEWNGHEILRAYRTKLLAALREAFPKMEVNTPLEASVPTTINFAIPGFTSAELIDLFDSAGMRISAGSACNSGSAKPSHVLAAMGLHDFRATANLRLSFGPATSEAEIERGCQAIREAAMALMSSCMLEATGGFQVPSTLRDGVIQLRGGATSCWLLVDAPTKTCVVIDPTDALAGRLVQYIQCQDLKIAAILDTHSHADHASVRPELQELLRDRLEHPKTACDELGWPKEQTGLVMLANGTTVPAIALGSGRVLAAQKTPGHTVDSQVFLLGTPSDGKLERNSIQFAFCGDTILSGGLGRTNFAVSDVSLLYGSLRTINLCIGAKTLLCPAHDYTSSFATTMASELETNPLLALAVSGPNTAGAAADLAQIARFVKEKEEIDLRLTAIETEFQGMVCGVACSTKDDPTDPIEIGLEALRSICAKSATAPLLIDVREPQEVTLMWDWSRLGLPTGHTPRNVPLSRLVNFMGELAAVRGPIPEIVLLCRSGTRSASAAHTLRRLGLGHAVSLRSGVAAVLE